MILEFKYSFNSSWGRIIDADPDNAMTISRMQKEREKKEDSGDAIFVDFYPSVQSLCMGHFFRTF